MASTLPRLKVRVVPLHRRLIRRNAFPIFQAIEVHWVTEDDHPVAPIIRLDIGLGQRPVNHLRRGGGVSFCHVKFLQGIVNMCAPTSFFVVNPHVVLIVTFEARRNGFQLRPRRFQLVIGSLKHDQHRLIACLKSTQGCRVQQVVADEIQIATKRRQAAQATDGGQNIHLFIVLFERSHDRVQDCFGIGARFKQDDGPERSSITLHRDRRFIAARFFAQLPR